LQEKTSRLYSFSERRSDFILVIRENEEVTSEHFKKPILPVRPRKDPTTRHYKPKPRVSNKLLFTHGKFSTILSDINLDFKISYSPHFNPISKD